MNIEQDTDSVSSDKQIQSKDLQINIYSKSYSAYIETRKKKQLVYNLFFLTTQLKKCRPVWMWILRMHAEFREILGIIPWCMEVRTKICLNTFTFNIAHPKVSIHAQR